MLTSLDIRERFRKYFVSKGHLAAESSPVIPQDDPTLLFTNAGMNQFKNVFIGIQQPPAPCATSCQKCIRAGGKHNDLDNVGKTPRHHTFFEMLGNFSFGAYFKKEAIAYAWEFLTKEMGLPKEYLWVTIYLDDDESFEIWKEHVSPDRIVRLGKKDNFWEMGDTGPCGPCSEIHIDLPAYFGFAEPAPFDDKRCMELWNLVFTQFNRQPDGSLEKLPRPCVDTGAGLERLTSVVQKKYSNYETDVFMPLLDAIAKLSGKAYVPFPPPGKVLEGAEKEAFDGSMAHRVVADHIRALVFSIADGAMPSNEGRGYVLRRILRRAARYGRTIGITKPFLASLVPVVVESMGGVYPLIREREKFIEEVINGEEVRFCETLSKGEELFYEIAASSKDGKIAGADAFRLYDTYGFPLDITLDMAAEKGLTVDQEGFEAELKKQRERAKAARNVSGKVLTTDYEELYAALGDTVFTGYSENTGKSVVTALMKKGEGKVEELASGDVGQIFVKETPFYAESGGQIGDVGTITGSSFAATVTGTIHPARKLTAHNVEVTTGTVKVGDEVELAIDLEKREATRRHHTAAHLFHAALREVVGSHATQAGSYVSPERMRFDFHSPRALTEEELSKIEARVNEVIWQDIPVDTKVTNVDEAKAMGATMLFSEKYGSEVRMLRIGDFSLELCGGTHAKSTGQLGGFYIVEESALAAGIRRVEAHVAAAGYKDVTVQRAQLKEAANYLHARPDEVMARLEKQSDEIKELQKKLKALQGGQVKELAKELAAKAETVGDLKVVAADCGELDGEGQKALCDALKANLQNSYAVAIAVRANDRCAFTVLISEEGVKAGLHAGNIVKAMAAITGGGGGGKPNQAQAGGKDAAKIPLALEKAKEMFANKN